MWRSGFHKSRDMCFCLFLDGLHFIGSDCDGETPVDECYRGEERYHHHVAHPTCFEEEEADEAEEYAIDDAKPPVSGAASGACGYECLNAPENEDNGKEIGEYHFGKYDTAHQHEANEHVDNTSGNPPAPAFGTVGPGSHT